jgi:hypothetical protein
MLCVFVGKKINEKDVHKEIFLAYGWKCLSRKAIYNCVEKFSQGRSTSCEKWPKTTFKNFYAAGFEALVKRWDKFINVGGGYIEK